jgi:hypothetical protein
LLPLVGAEPSLAAAGEDDGSVSAALIHRRNGDAVTWGGQASPFGCGNWLRAGWEER